MFSISNSYTTVVSSQRKHRPSLAKSSIFNFKRVSVEHKSPWALTRPHSPLVQGRQRLVTAFPLPGGLVQVDPGTLDTCGEFLLAPRMWRSPQQMGPHAQSPPGPGTKAQPRKQLAACCSNPQRQAVGRTAFLTKSSIRTPAAIAV